MTRTPPEAPDEELDDDAIVAQQSAVHSPQRRVQVKVESRSVVVAEGDAEATRELEAYTAGATDPTMVVRDRDRRTLARAVAGMPARSARRRSWVAIAIWGGAGLLALGLGALLATVHQGGTSSSSRAASLVASPAVAPAPSAVPASPPVASSLLATSSRAARDAAAPSSSAGAPALELDQLPVERGRRPPARRGHVTARPPAPTAEPRTRPASPVSSQPVKGAIPSGI